MEGFIPPPFPFVEAWPRVFQSEDWRRWLTPFTDLPVAIDGRSLGDGRGLQAPAFGIPAAPFAAGRYEAWEGREDANGLAGPTDMMGGEPSGGEDEENEEYEYGFVLTDEWRERLLRRAGGRASHRDEQHDDSSDSSRDKKRRPHRNGSQRKSKQASSARRQFQKQQTPVVAVNSRAVHLQQEIEAARTRELSMQWKQQQQRGSAGLHGPTARQLEAAMDLRFDEFCDAFQPVVWPHASAQ